MQSDTNEKAMGLEPLRRELPGMPERPDADEHGEISYEGFTGDFSRHPEYVTDGHLLLLASAIDPAVEIWRDESHWGAKYATTEATEKVWKAAEERTDTAAVFLGCAKWKDSVETALQRDTEGRVMVLNAHLLAFGVYAVRPDALTVNAAAIKAGLMGTQFESPLALRRDGRIVGLVMSMRLTRHEFPAYDLDGDPAELVLGVRP